MPVGKLPSIGSSLSRLGHFACPAVHRTAGRTAQALSGSNPSAVVNAKNNKPVNDWFIVFWYTIRGSNDGGFSETIENRRFEASPNQVFSKVFSK